MAVFNNNVLAGASGQTSGAAAGYQIDRSLRFNSADGANLSRTFSAGNRRTWTWSGWVKRGLLGTGKYGLFGGSGTNSMIRFNNDDGGDNLRVLDSATGGYDLITNRKFRDPSAWYHFVVAVDTTQSTSSDRVKIYVNGVQETSFYSSSYPTQNAELTFNNNISHTVGYAPGSTYHDGLMADVHFVDGTQLAATDFGEEDSNGVWQPKNCKDDLTYGTNGFYLKFADNTSTTTIAEDSSGNNNDWTANNISVSSGSGNDSLIDTPTNYTADSGNNGGNYCTWNPLDVKTTIALSNGNLDLVGSTDGRTRGTLGMPSGKFYWEITVGSAAGNHIGIWATNIALTNDSYRVIYLNGGVTVIGGSLGTAFNSYTDGDVIGIAFDAATRQAQFFKNGTSEGTLTAPELPAGSVYTPACIMANTNSSNSANFGQRPFTYTPPTGYVSLCTTNLPDPTIADGSTAMDVVTYSGDGTNGRDITVNHSTDLVWIKSRNQTDNHILADIVRGTDKIIFSHTNLAERSDSTVANSVTAFNSDGFTIGNNANAAQTNQSGFTYVAWSWDGGTSTVSNTDGSITSNVRANASAGFSIVGYQGTGTAATIGHGLNAAPEFIIVKNRDTARPWSVFHQSITNMSSGYLNLNFSNAFAGSYTGVWNGTDPTSSVFSVGTDNESNNSGDDFIAYCWTSVSQYSSFGSYVGNGSSDGPFVFTGHRARFLMIKCSTKNGEDWLMLDTARDAYNDGDSSALYASLSHADNSTSTITTDILSNGFKARATNAAINASGQTYIYMSFALHPFATARAR